MKKIKNYIIDMISDTSGHINSKIVLGVISFIVATILGFLKADIRFHPRHTASIRRQKTPSLFDFLKEKTFGFDALAVIFSCLV